MKISIAQICSSQDIKDNLNRCIKFIEKAAKDNPDIIVFPESLFHIGTPEEDLKIAKQNNFKETIEKNICPLAKKYNVNILLGGVQHLASFKKFYNLSIPINRKGLFEYSYVKLHLFDIDIPGKIQYKESDSVYPGSIEGRWNIDNNIKAGITICYDLRFPYLYQILSDCSMCFVTAAFTIQTGKDHWLPLLRARAIENQFYIIAANQCGNHRETNRSSYGHSCIVDPWGKIIGRLRNKEGILTKDIDLSYVNKVRLEMPVISHRRNLK